MPVVSLRFLLLPREVVGSGGRVTGVLCERARLEGPAGLDAWQQAVDGGADAWQGYENLCEW